MPLGRFVLTANVTLTPDAVAAIVAGEPGTGGPAGFGNTATIVPSALSQGKYGLPGMPLTLLEGTAIYADSAAGFDSGAKLLYQAIGAGNLRAFVQGADDVGHQGYRTNGRTVGGWLAGDGMMAIWNIRSVADADCWLREAFQIEPTVWRRFVIRG